jgi:hypothetical protein
MTQIVGHGGEEREWFCLGLGREGGLQRGEEELIDPDRAGGEGGMCGVCTAMSEVLRTTCTKYSSGKRA